MKAQQWITNYGAWYIVAETKQQMLHELRMLGAR